MSIKEIASSAYISTLKVLLLTFNFLFLTLGISFVLIGIYGLKTLTDFFQFTTGTYLFLPIIGVGLLMTVVGALSMWCTPKGISWLLHAYATFVFFVFTAVLVISVMFLVKRAPVEAELNASIQNSIQTYDLKPNAIDLIQRKMKCCGSNNYTDWFEVEWSKNMHRVPVSCCLDAKNCTSMSDRVPAEPTDIYTQGCFDLAYETIETKYGLIAAFGFIFAFVILLGSVLACVLATHIRRSRYESIY